MPDPATAAPDTPITAPPPIAPPAPADPPPLPPHPVISEVHLEDEDKQDGVTTSVTGLTLPAPAFKRIKDRAVARGRRDAETDMLKQLGVTTIEEAHAIIAKSKEPVIMPDPVIPAPITVPPAAAVVPTPAPTPPPVVVAPTSAPTPPIDERALPEATRRALREQREAAEARATAAAADAQAARTAAAAATEAANATIATVREESRVRESMITAGVVEVDYVFTKLQEHVATLDPAAKLAWNDEARTKWLTDYKAAKPFLFREHVAPANTGGGSPPRGTPPGPGQIAAGSGAAGAKDYRQMTDAERSAAAPPGIKIPQGSHHRRPASR